MRVLTSPRVVFLKVASFFVLGSSDANAAGQGFYTVPLFETVDSSKLTILVTCRSLCLSRWNFRPFRLQPPQSHFTSLGSTLRTGEISPPAPSPHLRSGTSGRSGFDSSEQSPRQAWLYEFVILRTGHLSLIAPHLSLGNAVTINVQASNDDLEGTCTLLFKRLHRRTRPSLRRRHAGALLWKC